MSSEKSTTEEKGWLDKAAACDEGRGLPLEECDPDNEKEMKFVYESLEEKNPYARARLRGFIRSLRQQQQRRELTTADGAPDIFKNALSKRPRVVHELVQYDAKDFWAPMEIPQPEVDETGKVYNFLAPKNWLTETRDKILDQAGLKESDNPRVSPLALIRCSRGGKSRTMIELSKAVKRKDQSYSVVYVTFNTLTPLEKVRRDPVNELCVRIAFAARKKRDAVQTAKEFQKFYESNEVGIEWVEDWLGDGKCILFIDELNLLEDFIGDGLASVLKTKFLLNPGRGFVFSSHVASLRQTLAKFISSPGNRPVILCPLPLIPSLQQARENFAFHSLSAQEALILGLIPGLIVERKNNRPISERRTLLIQNYIQTLNGMQRPTATNEVRKMLRSLLTGNPYNNLQELMTADIRHPDGKTILRWIPFHMSDVLFQLSQEGVTFLPNWMCHGLKEIVDLFKQFETAKWESGDAWEALFLIILLVRCLSGLSDNLIIPQVVGSVDYAETIVQYNQPFIGGENDFFTTDPHHFIQCIPLRKPPGFRYAISIYYPKHARFQAYDVILACWDEDGNRELRGYQLKEGSTTPTDFAYSNIFEKSFLVRGAPCVGASSVRLWRVVNEEELDAYFGESAAQWSAKSWKTLQSGGAL